MGTGVDGRTTELQDFGGAVRARVAAVAAPGASQAAELYPLNLQIPAENLMPVANEFRDALLSSGTSIKHWDGGFRGTGDFYAAFATLLGANVSDVDNAHGQALQDLYQQIGNRVPPRAS